MPCGGRIGSRGVAVKHQEWAQLIANYCAIASFALGLFIALPGLVSKTQSPIPAASPTPEATPKTLDGSSSEVYRGMNRFYGNTAIDRFIQNVFEVIVRWAQEDPIAATISSICTLIAIVLFAFGRSVKRKAARPPD